MSHPIIQPFYVPQTKNNYPTNTTKDSYNKSLANNTSSYSKVTEEIDNPITEAKINQIYKQTSNNESFKEIFTDVSKNYLPGTDLTTKHPMLDAFSDIKMLHRCSILPRFVIDVFLKRVNEKINKNSEALFNSTLQNQTKDKPINIIIRIKDKMGYGDLLFALKLGKIISDDKYIKSNVALVCEDESTLNKLTSITSGTTLKSYLITALPTEYKENGLCIGAATFYGDDDDLKDLKYTEMGLGRDYPYINLTEYGFGIHPSLSPDKVLNLGFLPNEYGVFIDKNLTETTRKDKEENKDQLNHIHELQDENLKNSILGKSTIEEYAKKTNLYFGYGHKKNSHQNFIRSVVCLENTTGCNKNIDMVLVYNDPSQKYEPETKEEDKNKEEKNFNSIFDENLQKELVTEGIGSVIITNEYLSGDNQETIIHLPNSTGQKIVRLFVKGKLAHEDMEKCLIMSQPLTMIVGNQSLSEAISSDKICIYESWGPAGLQVYDSVFDLAAEHGFHRVKEFFKKSTTFANVNLGSLTYAYSHCRETDSDYFQTQTTHDEYKVLVQDYLTNEEFRKEWASFTKEIQTNYSIEKKLLPTLKRKIATIRSSTIKDQEAKMIKAAKKFL